MKNRHLLIPTTIVETIVKDLDDKEKLELINIIFTHHLGYEEPTIESRLVRVTWNNLKPIVELYRYNYETGLKGGAPKGNQNAKKKQPETTLKTTPVVLVENNLNNPKDKYKDKDIDKDKGTDRDIDKDIDKILEKLYERNTR